MQDSPVLADLYPNARFRGDMAAGVNVGMTGIAYNKKMFTEKGWAAPTSWMDFADPKFKGKVVFQSLPVFDLRPARLPDVQPHPGRHRQERRARLQGLAHDHRTRTCSNTSRARPSSRKWCRPAKRRSSRSRPRPWRALKGKGVPVEYAQPKEGSVVLIVGECVIANNSEPALAHKLARIPAVARSPGAGAAARRPDPVQPEGQGER